MQKHFYSLLMAVFLVIALTLPGKAAKAEASQDDFQYFGEDEAADPNVGGEDFPVPVEEDIPEDPVTNSYDLYTNVSNGEVVVLYETPYADNCYSIPEGTQVFFYGIPDEGCYPADSTWWYVDGEDIERSNPVISYYDENGEFQYFAPQYDSESGWYSFYMQPSSMFITITFLPIQDTPVEPVTNSYGLYPNAINGEVVVLYETADENGYYSVPEGTRVFFYGIPDEGCYLAESTLWYENGEDIERSNPVISYFDENGNLQYFAPLYDDETGWYSFYMQPSDMYINMAFLPIQDTPVEPVTDSYGLYPNTINGEVVVLYETADENGYYSVPEGTRVFFYGIPDEGCYLADSTLWYEDGEDIERSNPVIYYYDEDGNCQFFAPLYDDETGWYSFYMQPGDMYINMAFLPIQDTPENPVIETRYPIQWYASNGELTIVEPFVDEEGYYLAPEGAEVSFSVMPEDGFCYADHINFLVGEEILELPNPLVSYTDDDGIFHYIVPTYDDVTGWYTFTMPDSYVFINVDFTEINPGYFIGRVVAEGGSIEFVPENPESSACEGDIVTVEVTADQGYNLDEVVIFNAATLEDGSIEYIEDSYVDFWKNEDGTYSFVMPANPVQIFANFSKPSNPNSGSNGHGNGWGNGFGWGFGHNYGWGCGYGHGIGYGYGHNNYGYGYGYGYGNYGFGYGYGNSCHSLLGGLVGLLNSWGLFR